jgi:hypothetical protein
VDVPTCRVCGFAILEVIDHGRDLYDGLCGDCAYRKFMLQHGLAPGPEPCEWCSELETGGPLVAFDDGRGEGRSWVCQRCYRGALAHER